MIDRDFHNRAKERWALISRKSGANKKLAILLHGFMGSHLGTWGLMPDLLRSNSDTDPVLTEWDFLFSGYPCAGPTGVTTFGSIANLVATHWRHAHEGTGPFSSIRRYDEFALIAHSLGTLGVRQLIADEAQRAVRAEAQCVFKTAVRLAFFGTPVAGSGWALIGRLFAPIGTALKPGSPQIAALHKHVTDCHALSAWPTVEIIVNESDVVVGSPFAAMIKWPGDTRTPTYTVLGHTEMCKPDSWSSQPIDFLRDALR